MIRNYGPSPVSVTGYSNKMGLLDEEDEGVTFQSDSEEDDQDDSEPEEERQVKVKALKKAVAGANKGMRFLAGMDGGAEEDDDDEVSALLNTKSACRRILNSDFFRPDSVLFQLLYCSFKGLREDDGISGV